MLSGDVGCDNLNFYVSIFSMVIILSYILLFLLVHIIRGLCEFDSCKCNCKCEPLIHDTISSSIYDANNPYKRAFNVCLGCLSFMMICLYLDEYDSRLNKYSHDYERVYIVDILSFGCLAFIAIFPGGDAYRRSGNSNKWVDIIHGIISFSTLFSINVTNLYYANKILGHPFVIHLSFFSGVSIIASVAMLGFSINNSLRFFKLKDFPQKAHKKYDQQEYQFLPEQNNDLKRIQEELIRKNNFWCYLFESIAFCTCVIFAIISSLFRNDHIPCIKHSY